ncbi:4a-hydroxytetrahydrobiopterin dehydratase [Cellulomonas sp. KRMCY2]|uniref:4a-hydroxytetrahydrobiopterin dehydratase n=1 Tax=Cellulomonas sp. KRMCY2 TaxID=1304865 RepID=UPI00045E6890|nr:4a-hydroxytetrahydrobiopterin dehydratase [Cellulomonas sp. KRMCY2]
MTTDAEVTTMTGQITARQFHDSDGVQDWRVLAFGACAYFRTGSFATGVALVDRIGEQADAANHHPDVDLRYSGVTVRLFTHDVLGLTEEGGHLVTDAHAPAWWTLPTRRATRSTWPPGWAVTEPGP